MSKDQLRLACALNPSDGLSVFESATQGQRLFVVSANCYGAESSVYLTRDDVTRLRNKLTLWLAERQA